MTPKQATEISLAKFLALALLSGLLLCSCASFKLHPISLLLAATEDRDQEIVPSAEDHNRNFGHETSALGSGLACPGTCALAEITKADSVDLGKSKRCQCRSPYLSPCWMNQRKF